MNSLSLLVSQNKSYDTKILEQGKEIFELISKAILKDQNYIEYNFPIYATNYYLLFSKGYIVINQKIIWNDYLINNEK
jgi:hypothetical protein